MSSSDSLKSNEPLAISWAMLFSPASMPASWPAVSSPHECRPRARAIEPATSKGASRTSTASDDENRSSSGSRPSSKRALYSFPVGPDPVPPFLAFPVTPERRNTRKTRLQESRCQLLYVGRQEAVQVHAGESALDFGRGPNTHPEQLDKTRRSTLVEPVPVAIGCQLDPVELLWRLASDHLG